MQSWEARALFERLVSVPDAEVDLLRASLAIAAEEHPALDVEARVAEVEDIARAAKESMSPLAGPARRLVRLNELLFRDLEFDGKRCDFEDPASSFLDDVLDRKTGLPIALSVLFVCVGRRVGLQCDGIGFPGHFLAKVTTDISEIFLDPFRGGQVLSHRDLEERLKRAAAHARLGPDVLRAATHKEILARMLRNLKNLYVRKKDLARAYAAVDRILVAMPESAEDLRDRGLLAMQLGHVGPAERDFAAYLALAPEAPDSSFVKAKREALRGQRTLLN